MAEEQRLLAAEVMKHRHLYDASHSGHRDHTYVDYSWGEIAATVGKEKQWVKKTWKNLRDRYVKAKRSYTKQSGDPGKRKNVPSILEELSWLSTFVSHRETDSKFHEVEVALEETETNSFQSPPLPSISPSSSTWSAVSPTYFSTPENTPVPTVEQMSPTVSGGKRSPSTSAGPELKTRKIEDMVLMRLENLDKENATHKDMESTRFGYFVADMMEKIPDHKKDAVKLKIYQLLYEAVQPEKIPSKPLENGRDNSVEDPASAAGPSTSSQSIDNMLPPSEEELLGFLPEYTGSSDDVAIKQEPDTWSSDSEHTQDSSSHHISTQTKNANKHMSMKKKKLQVMQAMLQQQKRSSQAIEETGRDVRQAMQQQNLLQERMVNLLEKMIQNPSNTSASSAQSGVNEGNHEG
uniref:MADF domain-containing protein n=1 Tax=Amphiprion ocellaris TaxID=80972 RepID=A0AAQ5YQC1_AMPOC